MREAIFSLVVSEIDSKILQEGVYKSVAMEILLNIFEALYDDKFPY